MHGAATEFMPFAEYVALLRRATSGMCSKALRHILEPLLTWTTGSVTDAGPEAGVDDTVSLDRLHSYLAQCSIFNSSGPAPLAHLWPDLQPLPSLVPRAQLVEVNLWCSGRATSSNLHYDENHNVLCVLAGFKRVTLLPPSATALLRPHSLADPSPNHSQLSHAELREVVDGPARAQSLVVTLVAGDSLFIPEGWWHQVDSGPAGAARFALAVNFWWRGPSTRLEEDALPFFLRNTFVRVVAMERERVFAALRALPACVSGGPSSCAAFLAGLEAIEALPESARWIDSACIMPNERISQLAVWLAQTHWSVWRDAVLASGAVVPRVLALLCPFAAAALVELVEAVEENDAAAAAFLDKMFSAAGDREATVAQLIRLRGECQRRLLRHTLAAVCGLGGTEVTHAAVCGSL